MHQLFIVGFFYSGFLGVPVNINDLGAADRPDVLHRSHLTDHSGTEPRSSPSSHCFHHVHYLHAHHLCQAAVNLQSSTGCWLFWKFVFRSNCVMEGSLKAFWVQLFYRLWQSQTGFYTGGCMWHVWALYNEQKKTFCEGCPVLQYGLNGTWSATSLLFNTTVQSNIWLASAAFWLGSCPLQTLARCLTSPFCSKSMWLFKIHRFAHQVSSATNMLRTYKQYMEMPTTGRHAMQYAELAYQFQRFIFHTDIYSSMQYGVLK